MRPLCIADFNNTFSFSGGGVRTYHLRKLDYFSRREDVSYALIVPSDRDDVEHRGNARLFHLQAPPIPGATNYRLMLNPRKLLRIIDEVQPDLIEAGGPYIDPLLMRLVARRFPGVIIGFWHTHYPSAYFDFYGRKVTPALGKLLERVGWALARTTYGFYDATVVAADCIIQELRQAGLKRIIQCPLGVDADLFHPRHFDAALRRTVGAEDRPLVFFPHRLLQEKGIAQVVQAAPRIADATGAVFVFAGVGPEQALVESLCQRRDDCHYIGFVDTPAEMARWHASSDVSYGLSAWETFGFSVLEAMASGVPLVGADRGAARDWIRRANCGLLVAHGDVEATVAATIDLLRRSDRQAMGQRGRQLVAEHLSWDAAFTRMHHYYQQLVDAHRAGTHLQGFPFLLQTTPDAPTTANRDA